MTLDSKTILDFIREKSDHPMKPRELAKALGIKSTHYGEFRRTLKELIGSGELVKLKRGRIGLASEMDIVVGKVSVTRAGTGFVAREGAEDLMIPPHLMHTALDGDTVMARVAGHRNGRQAGSIVRVVERTERNIVGVFRRKHHFCFVTPDNPHFHRDVFIPEDKAKGARDGEKVVAVLTVWEDPHINPEGRITERLGMPHEPGVDMLTIIRSFHLPGQFPDEVLAEAEQAAVMPPEAALRNRRNLIHECVYTIDPMDAKDHDDAVSVVRTKRGYRLGVHIADVSYFVEAGSALDREAFERGNSVYLPGMVIPMLPEALSNNICSLKPNRRRLAFSVFMDFDGSGKMLGWELADTIVKSRSKLAYREVQALFDGDAKLPDRVERVADDLRLARELAQVLSQRRFAAGSLDFDLPEAKLVLSERGDVLEVGSRVRTEAHRLVEEFMLVANRAVALHVFRLAQPLLYRVHERPDLEKVEAFAYMMERLGYKFTVSKDLKPLHFSRFLEKTKDRPEAELINELMLRSMQKAVYQRKNVGHFGLAFTHYAHFTSPIRRYPDLLVHRLLRRLENGRYPAAFARRVDTIIDTAGRQCSETERKAEKAEREAIKVKQVAYMESRVGDEFTGVISGVTGFGFFVRLADLGVEGLVRVSSIDDDYYRFEERQYRLVGRRTGRVFRLGDSVEVGVMKVNREQNEVELFLLDGGSDRGAGSNRRRGHKGARGRSRRKK